MKHNLNPELILQLNSDCIAPEGRLVLFILAELASSKDGGSTNVDELKNKTGLSKSEIEHSLNTLIQHEYIQISNNIDYKFSKSVLLSD